MRWPDARDLFRCLGRASKAVTRPEVERPAERLFVALTEQPKPTSIPKGWQCPKCSNVYAPHVDACSCTIST